MESQEIVEYVMHTPGNTNATILKQLIEDYGKNAGDSLWEKGTGEYSIQAKDSQCFASGDYSIASGYGGHAQAAYSKANGFICRTLKDEEEGIDARYARADGYMSDAAGLASSADGDTTHTQNIAEHAQGRGNISHKDSNNFGSAGNTIHSIGIANNNQDILTFKNAVEVMQNGDVYIKGVGGYDGKDIENAKTLQETISESSSGLIVLIRNLKLENFEETDKAFYGSADNIILPEDFFTNPFNYNLIVSVHGNADDTGIGGYTANHFCYLTGGINMWLCGDKFNFDEGFIDHFTSVSLSEEGHLEISYLGLMEPESGDRAQGDPLISECYVTVLLQKLI